MKGVIALDIDGTTTAERHHIPEPVVNHLAGLAESGWQIIFLTGRSYLWAAPSLAPLPFSYHMAVQNGAVTVSVPDKEILSTSYVDPVVLREMDAICADEPTDYTLFTGYEHDDVVYYRPEKFSPAIREYATARGAALGEEWRAVDSYDGLCPNGIASLKCFGTRDSVGRICERVEQELGLHCPLIGDPCGEGHYVAQATNPEADKGRALERFIAACNPTGPVIAAGDDNNDKPMFAVADIAIAMGSASEEIRSLADIVAPAATELGIIAGLNAAISKSEGVCLQR